MGSGVGNTRKGKGTRIMAVADGAGLPLAVAIASPLPAGVTLVEHTLTQQFLRVSPERLFAWLQNFRRLVTRNERHAENFLSMVQLGCIVILSRQFAR